MFTIGVDARSINSTTGRYVERLLSNLETIDQRNKYIVFVPSRDLNYYRPQSSRFAMVGADFESYGTAEQIGFLRLLNSYGPDLMHFCMPQQPILYNRKSITTVHDLTLLKGYRSHHSRASFEIKRAVGRMVFRRIGRTSSYVITPSSRTRSEYLSLSGVREGKVKVIYEGADRIRGDVVPFTPLLNDEFVMYVGTHSAYKNVRRLIEAHQQLLTSRPELRLALVGRIEGRGGASLRPTLDWVQENGFSNILFTGYVTDEQLAWLYLHARAYIFPSFSEGFGLPGLEALTYGTPLVSSNRSCLPEVYGDAALYFDPSSVESMIQAVTNVLDDDNLAEDLRQRGFMQSSRYSWRDMATRTLALYESILEQD